MTLEAVVMEEGEAKEMGELVGELSKKLPAVFKEGRLGDLILSEISHLLFRAGCRLRPLMLPCDEEKILKGIIGAWGLKASRYTGAELVETDYMRVCKAIETIKAYLTLFYPTREVKKYWKVQECSKR